MEEKMEAIKNEYMKAYNLNYHSIPRSKQEDGEFFPIPSDLKEISNNVFARKHEFHINITENNDLISINKDCPLWIKDLYEDYYCYNLSSTTLNQDIANKEIEDEFAKNRILLPKDYLTKSLSDYVNHQNNIQVNV